MATAGVTPTDAYTRYSRIVLVLGKCCTEVERKVLEAFLSYTNQTLDQFLLQNKATILTKRNGKHNQRLYFPLNQKADLQIWDLGAVCFILTDFSSVPQQQKDDICHLRRIRNEICHCNSPDLGETNYLSHKDDIQNIIDTALSYVNDSGFRQHIEKQVKEIEQGTFSAEVDNSLRQLNTWYEVVEELKADHVTTHGKLDELLRFLQANITHTITAPEYTADLEMQNCTADQETSLTKQFIGIFHDCIKGTKLGKRLADDERDDLNQAIHETCKKLKIDGKTVKAVKPKCVRLQISCSSTQSLFSLIEDCASGRLTEIFEPIETAVRKLTGFADYRQQVVMYREDYVACVYNIVASICASVSQIQISNAPKSEVTPVGRAAICLKLNHVNEEHREVHELVENFMSLSKAIEISFQDDELKLEIENKVEVSKHSKSRTRDVVYETVIPMYANVDAIEKQAYAREFRPAFKICYDDEERTGARDYSMIGDASPLTPSTRHDDTRLNVICPIHNETKESIEFYCPAHDDIGCGECIVLTHRTCSKVNNISDASKGFKDSLEFKNLIASINSLEQRISDCDDIIKETSKSNMKVKQTALDSIRNFRTDILVYLDKREEELVREMDTINTQDDKVFADIKSQSENSKKKLQEIKQEIESRHETSKKLFISAKQRKSDIKALKKVLVNSTKEVKTRRQDYKFNRDMAIEEIMSSRRPLGNLDNSMVATTLDLVRARCIPSIAIVTHSREDKNKCDISGMGLLSPGILVLAESGNNAVKIVDAVENKVISHLQLSTKPYDLTILPEKQVAVTIGDGQKIQILAAHSNTLSKLRVFSVSGQCRGIDYKMGKLAVIYFDPVKVEIMDTKGVVAHVINLNKNNTIRGYCSYVMFAGTGLEVLVTCKDDSVKKLSLQGDVLASYSYPELCFPCGIAVTEAEGILVCGYGSHIVYACREDDTKHKTLLSQQDGLYCPTSLCVSEENGMLYVGGCKDVLNTFKVQQ